MTYRYTTPELGNFVGLFRLFVCLFFHTFDSLSIQAFSVLEIFSGQEIKGWGHKLKSYDRRRCHVSSHRTLVEGPGGAVSAGTSVE